MTWKQVRHEAVMAQTNVQLRMSSCVGAGLSARGSLWGENTHPYRDDATIGITEQSHTSFTAHNNILLSEKHILNSQCTFLDLITVRGE